jgi:hypothetical protein
MAEGRLKGRYGDAGKPVGSLTPVLSSSNDSLDDMARTGARWPLRRVRLTTRQFQNRLIAPVPDLRR